MLVFAVVLRNNSLQKRYVRKTAYISLSLIVKQVKLSPTTGNISSHRLSESIDIYAKVATATDGRSKVGFRASDALENVKAHEHAML